MVSQELDNCLGLFIAVQEPHAALSIAETELVCTGLVGAGEAISSATVRGQHTVDEARRCALDQPDGRRALCRYDWVAWL